MNLYNLAVWMTWLGIAAGTGVVVGIGVRTVVDVLRHDL